MAIKFSENSGLNNGLWKDTDLAIRSWMKDTDTEQNKYDDVLNAMFNVKKSDQFGEKLGSVTEFGDFEIVPEGGKAVQDDIQEGFDKLIIHEQAIKGFTVTANMREDNKIDDMKSMSEQFVRSYKRSRLAEATALLTGATATTVRWGGKNLDATCNDGKALFATDHPGKKAGVGTQSNIFTDEFGTTDEVLYELANVGSNFLNQSGQPMGYDFDTIMIPSNAPDLQRTIAKIIGSDQQVGSNYNDINVSKGMWKLIVNPLWRVTTDKKPFIIMSSRANKELRGNMFYNRVDLTVNPWIDNATYDLNYSGRYRVGCGFNAWQHILLGGAQSGSSL